MKRRDIERESNQLVESLRMGGKRALEGTKAIFLKFL